MKHFAVLLLVIAAWFAGAAVVPACNAAEASEIYYLDGQGNLAKEYRQIMPDDNLYFALAQAVAQPPQSQHLSTAVPYGTQLHDAWFDRGIVYVDYTKELFSYGGGTFWEQRLLAQIVYTLTQRAEVQGVQILVAGRKVVAPEGSPTDAPMARNDLPLLGREARIWPESE